MVDSLLKRNPKTHPQLNFPDYKSSCSRAPKNKKISFLSTKTEISGPVFNKNILGRLDNDLTLNFSKRCVNSIHLTLLSLTLSHQ